MSAKNTTKSNQQGFTIVELLIATLVFSTIILVITFGIIQFSRSYYRGVTTSNLQNTARSVIDSISQAIQFSGSDISSSAMSKTVFDDDTGTYCLGGVQIDYVLHSVRAKTGTVQHVLYSTPTGGGGACTHKAFDPNSSKDLVDVNMRIVSFGISSYVGGSSSNLWKIQLKLAYGDDDLLCSPSLSAATQGSCSSKTYPTSFSYINNNDLMCKLANGSQFCAVSALTTVVQKRVQ